MSIISDRVAVKELAGTTLTAAFAAQTSNPDLRTVSVHYGLPGESQTDEMVVLGRIAGNSDAVVFGPRGSDDEFTIEATIYTDGHESEVAACRRAQLILNELNDALFTSRFAQSLNAIVYPAKQDGPNGDPPLDGQPAVAVVELTIACAVSVRGA